MNTMQFPLVCLVMNMVDNRFSSIFIGLLVMTIGWEVLVSHLVFRILYPPNCSFFLRQSIQESVQLLFPCIFMCMPIAEEKTYIMGLHCSMGAGSCFGDWKSFRGRSRAAQWYNGGSIVTFDPGQMMAMMLMTMLVNLLLLVLGVDSLNRFNHQACYQKQRDPDFGHR